MPTACLDVMLAGAVHRDSEGWTENSVEVAHPALQSDGENDLQASP